MPRLPSRRDEIGTAGPRGQRHEPVAAPPDRQYRGVRRRRHPRAQEPARLAALRGRRPRPGRGPGAAQRSCSTSSARTCVRLDRLISDIGEAARTDAELARARFEPVDLGPLIGQIVAGWETRRETGNVRIAFARPRRASAIVLGEPGRLARAIDNIIDNAISFSPPGGLVEIAATHVGDEIRIRIDDEGPGVPAELREAIFNRFHSVRPEAESFGRHSGLGLAIARAIVEGHDGEIDVTDRDDAPSGARFTITLPAAPIGGRDMSIRLSLRNAPRHHRRDRRPRGADHRPVGIGQVRPGAAPARPRLHAGQRRPDDRPEDRRPADRLGARRRSRGKLEVRGIGIVEMDSVDDVPVALVVELTSDIQRLPDDSRERLILGIAHAADQRRRDDRVGPSKVALALDRLGLKF